MGLLGWLAMALGWLAAIEFRVLPIGTGFEAVFYVVTFVLAIFTVLAVWVDAKPGHD